MNPSEMIKRSAINATNIAMIENNAPLAGEPSPFWTRVFCQWKKAGVNNLDAAKMATEQEAELLQAQFEEAM